MATGTKCIVQRKPLGIRQAAAFDPELTVAEAVRPENLVLLGISLRHPVQSGGHALPATALSVPA